MDALRSKLNAKMEAKMRELPDWSYRELWAQTHAKEQSKLFKKFVEDTVSAAFPAPKPAAAGGAAEADGAAGDEAAAAAPPPNIEALAAAAVATPAFAAAIAEMTKLLNEAKGLSHSVLMASRLQQGGGYGYGGYRGFIDSDDEDGMGMYDM